MTNQINQGDIVPISKNFDVRVSDKGPVLKLSISLSKKDFKIFNVEENIKSFLSTKSFDNGSIDTEIEELKSFFQELEASVITARNHGRIELNKLK